MSSQKTFESINLSDRDSIVIDHQSFEEINIETEDIDIQQIEMNDPMFSTPTRRLIQNFWRIEAAIMRNIPFG